VSRDRQVNGCRSLGTGSRERVTCADSTRARGIHSGRVNIYAPRSAAASNTRGNALVFGIRKASRGRSHGAKL